MLISNRQPILVSQVEWDLTYRRQRTGADSFIRVFIDQCRSRDDTQPEQSADETRPAEVLKDEHCDRVDVKESLVAAPEVPDALIKKMVELCEKLLPANGETEVKKALGLV